MAYRKLFISLIQATLLVCAPLGLKGADQLPVTVERNVTAKMRDGVVLRADIYRPNVEGKFPVLLMRTPYSKEYADSSKAAARGYVVIIQDCRGRYTSEGEWYPYKHEVDDGYDTVEWAAALPYSTGKVGMFGISYYGATQMLAAIGHPPHLAGIFPGYTGSNYYEGWNYQGGAFEQFFNESWTSLLAHDTLTRRIHATALDWIWTLPLSAYPTIEITSMEGLAPYFHDWLEHPSYDSYWKQWSIEEHHAAVIVPAYHVGGWYDAFMAGTLRNYVGIKAHGGSEAARRGQRLMIGPWYHGASWDTKSGDVDFGPQAKVDAGEEMFRWYDHLLKGVENGVDSEKPVKIFVMGKNVWRNEDDWPLARARSTRFYLHSGGKANSLLGDGTLSTKGPGSEPADQYVYDPAQPVPTRGGGTCCANWNLAPGAFDQRSNEARNDVLVYSTPPLDEEIEVTGFISLELFASSSAADTDFTGKLIDVAPDGFAKNLTDGIMRARYRNSPETPELMKPGETYKLTLDLWATSNVFLPGHRLRLEVSSSNFPRFDRNLNTAETASHSSSWVKATNVIYHDAEHPSALLLPVVPR